MMAFRADREDGPDMREALRKSLKRSENEIEVPPVNPDVVMEKFDFSHPVFHQYEGPQATDDTTATRRMIQATRLASEYKGATEVLRYLQRGGDGTYDGEHFEKRMGARKGNDPDALARHYVAQEIDKRSRSVTEVRNDVTAVVTALESRLGEIRDQL